MSRESFAVALVTLLLTACAPAERRAEPPGATALDAAALAERVRAEFLHAWEGYKTYAWGHDELLPQSRTGRDWHTETLYMTPVDALDTMILMGLDEEAAETRDFLAERLSFDKDISVKNFEITIRVLGGLLSAYQMSEDARLLALAEDLGQRLLPVFDSPTGMPYMYVNLATGETGTAESNPAEIGTLILELGTLARLTGRDVFYDLESLVAHCRTEAGYTVLESVVTREQGDRMHSFFLAETLKYLYLLFAADALDFNSVVFNTEAHPLRRTLK